MELTEIGHPIGQLETTCEKHGAFISRHLRLSSERSQWTECPKCLERAATCEKHGAFVSKTLTVRSGYWSSCPTCRAEERKREEEARRQYQEREKREDRDRFIASLVRAACIPDRFFLKTLADYKTTTEGERVALSVANNYVEEFADHLAAARCMVFCGSPGTGKTHLACAIAKSLAQSGRPTRYFTVQELIRSLRATWGRPTPEASETEAGLLRRLRALELLVLDEVGVQFGTEAERTQLTEVIDLRYRDMKPTLVVSNCEREELKKYLGDRIVDRLRENGGKFVIFDWPSRRV
jgi:DNA replication protein DnaC